MKNNGVISYLKIALTAFLVFAVSVIPGLIMTKGVWIYYGDFNVQQIPFYIHAHEAIRNGNFLYDWGLDLGGSLIGCFSFYLLGSPFFWITLPFRAEVIPYLMPWISALKYMVMAVTAYAYAKRHLKTENGAFIAALLYTFSGFQGAVLVYNHFHDVMAFFPLYLLLFERAMESGKRLGFILMTSFMAILNYYFFVGEAVFLVIYYVARYAMSDESSVEKVSQFVRAFFTGIAGVLLACIYLLPATYYTFHSSRVSETLMGYEFLAYKEPMAIWAIIKNTVMLPDISGLNSMYNLSFGRVSGVAAYIPMFSVSLVAAYFFINKGRALWEKRTIIICAIFASIPILNAIFSAMNSEYYARWFYMPILVMCVMTASLIETEESRIENRDAFVKGGEITFGITVFISLTALLPAKDSDGNLTMLGNLKNGEQLIAQIIFSIVMMIAFFLYIMHVSGKKDLYTRIFVVAACLATTMTMMCEGNFLVDMDRKTSFINQALSLETPLKESDEYYRIETEEDVYNYPLLWDAHSITSFISTIPYSTVDFYSGFGIRRKVTSNLAASKQGMRAFLSARYFLKENETAIEHIGHIDDMDDVKGYNYIEDSHGFAIYENEEFIPMGFSFDTYITETEFEEKEFNSTAKDRLLVRTVVLNDDVAAEYEDVLRHEDPETYTQTTSATFREACRARRESACTDFKTSTNGFTANALMEQDGVLVFTVPYETGFTAYVDGIETKVSLVDYGFMMIKVPEGSHSIEFKYIPSNYKYGKLLSVVGLLLIIIGLPVINICDHITKNNKKESETA